jgi:hypothetical protein
VHRVIERRARDANTAWLSHRLQSCCYVYPIAIDIVALDDDIAEIDPNAKSNLMCFGSALVSGGHFTLDRGCTLDSIYDTREFDECTVAHEFDHTAPELFYRWIDQFTTAIL